MITDKGEVFHADYIVDAGGMKLAAGQQVRVASSRPAARTRARIFTHMIDVPCFNEVGRIADASTAFPSALSEGTLHHVFRGGWLWVIPFNNHPRATNPLCSVGLQLDPRHLSATQPTCRRRREFCDFVDAVPRSCRPSSRDARAGARLDAHSIGCNTRRSTSSATASRCWPTPPASSTRSTPRGCTSPT
ncbi:MAG: hypothetical protein V9H69_19255 [Anaerolineae bacterium]